MVARCFLPSILIFFYICIASPSTFPSLNNGQYFALHCCQVMKAWLSCRKLRFRLRCLKLSFVMFSMWHFAWWKEQPRTLAVQVVLVISNTPGILEPISNIPGCSFEIYMFLLEVMQDMTPRSFTAVCRTYFWWKEARNRRQLYFVIHGPYKKSVSHEHNELLYMWFQFILCNRILIHPDLFLFFFSKLQSNDYIYIYIQFAWIEDNIIYPGLGEVWHLKLYLEPQWPLWLEKAKAFL